MKEYIIDIEGNLIEVTDLKEAIFQVAMYISFLFEEPLTEQQAFARKRIRYWKDLYHKLNLLKQQKGRSYEKN